ncbi:bifunctional 2',3'-cyclic-nucleotide 2'-phosphodiesterase/3'-nucleotidase [Neobacillus dielmonensis]|uniref:bifunctional 2',3'-cyclic-nucleotide 2'-phosphodiesterase/3'-nucleotidase n=1 Tax=Neobacillus dielmonensis TaxID=1347369 RepID=UPI00069471BA|nr:bifunctional 2',3'-cyclic-nucleotide 2'-phosphodiesterase/3'-nucleotidase [Neobacillus dielmonensis]
MLRKIITLFVSLMLAGIILEVQMPRLRTAAEEGEPVIQLRLLETTDIHGHLANYDYYQTKEAQNLGLAKTASLIKHAREEVLNSLLFDNGDNIQGNPLGDYMVKVKGLKKGETHPVFRALDRLGYDAVTVGNHEFNYGLDFLNRVIEGAKMPVVNANVYQVTQDEPYFVPYVILNKTVVDNRGREHTIKVGIIGFVPPQIMEWDKSNLEGNITVKPIVETAKKYIPMMKKEGADVIVALAHTGISSEPYEPDMENAAYYLAQLDGIDAILSGHSHNLFPGPLYKDLPHTNLEKGTIQGKPVVMAGTFGSHLGIIDLNLQKKQGKWSVVDGKSMVWPIAEEKGKSHVPADKDILKEIFPEHQATIDYVNQPVGETTTPIFSYFALVQDDPAVQIINNAQMNYLTEKLKDPAYSKFAGIPILSAASPFKAGGRGGPSYYTDIPAGTLAIKNIADLYVYPNMLQAVLINGEQLKEWLEMSAGLFNEINPAQPGEQQLINPHFRSYNFDVMDGVKYQIDVTKPAKYDYNNKLIHPNSSRIVNLTYQGKPVTPDQKFIVATNNYRAGSKTFPGVSKGKVIFNGPDETREILKDYIQENETVSPSADSNWSIAKFNGTATAVFDSSPTAQKFAKQFADIKYLGPSNGGFAKYLLDLTVQ